MPLAALAVLVGLLLLPADGAAAKRGLATGYADLLYADPELRGQVFDETVSLNADGVRLGAIWRTIAPASPPPGFEATDPADPAYDWGTLDMAVREAEARGLRVTLLVSAAPDWAETKRSKRPPPPCPPDEERCENNPSICPVGGPPCAAPGTWKPSPRKLAAFGTAVARRYSGEFGSLPRVRDYQLWAEPNLVFNLTPQWNGKKPVGADHYAKMLRAFYRAVHRVERSNEVIAGGTAPYGADRAVYNPRPLLWWRRLLCVRGRGPYRGVRCPNKPMFDAIAHHPINTSGGPRRGTLHPDDISTPDLGRLVRTLRAAERKGKVRPRGRHPVLATELWWESNPPDPAQGHPSPKRQARWYTEALYLLWRQGASEVVLLQVRDMPYDGNPGRQSGSYQSGVLFSDGSEKPAADAMRFPFVADRRRGRRVVLWGKAPAGGRLVVERKRSGGGYRRVAATRVRSGAVFRKRIKLRGRHVLRARVGGQVSPGWSLRR